MTARIGAPKTGGRKRGSIDREARKLLTDKMSSDLMFVYSKLGGRAWLLEFAEKNPVEFIRQGLSRLWPSPQKDDSADIQINQQFNIDNLSEREAAVRVAFALSKAIHGDPAIKAETVEDITVEPMTPRRSFPPWTPPTDAPDMPEPVDEERQRWVEELPLTEEQRRDNAVVRETREGSLATYRGGPGEQSGPGPDRSPVSRKLTVNERYRRMRRDELL
ncbi:hypothetical protein EI534_25900 [Pseudomonas frederiksbergensis]|nr:hypothetical protein [Pseudomonas frederiksbergensis]